MRRRYRLLPIALLFCFSAAAVRAQGVEWQERRTLLFSILYPTGAEDKAQQYAQWVDGTYNEVSAFWGYRPAAPIVLRIYPTMELYYQANPLAAKIPGVVAHANTGRREISVAAPQTTGQSEAELQNNVRHELTHIAASDLSGGRLTTPWQEGIAQYVEQPGVQLQRKLQLMRDIVAQNRLLTWEQLNQPGATYADPRVGYPESLTIAAFLIQRNGIERYRAFVEAMRDASGYREALQTAYGTPLGMLEQEWRAQLPNQLSTDTAGAAALSSGGGPVDLQQPEALIAQGNYAAAAQALRPMLDRARQSGDSAAEQQAQSLLARAEAGQRAVQLAADARNALVNGDYSAANEAGRAGAKQLEALGQAEQAARAAEYADLAARGLQAEDDFEEAGRLLRGFQIRGAEQRLLAAYTTFGELGDQARAGQARAALDFISRGEYGLVITCLIGGGLLMLWSSRRRYKERPLQLPFA